MHAAASARLVFLAMKREADSETIDSEDVQDFLKRQRPLALRIAREAVLAASVPAQTPGYEEFTDARWKVFHREENEDVVVLIRLHPFFTRAEVQCSLGLIAWAVLREMELLMSGPTVLEELAVEKTEVQNVIFDKSVQIVRDFLTHWPLVMFHAFHQGLAESIVGHIKKFVEYDLREHWNDGGKPKKFTILPNGKLGDLKKAFPEVDFQLVDHLEMINFEFEAYRKAASMDRQTWLTPKAFDALSSRYEDVRLLYKNARKEHKLEFDAYKRINKGKLAGWTDHWRIKFEEGFPGIYLNPDLEPDPPALLARRQLADEYGFSVDYIEKLVRSSKLSGGSDEKYG